MGAPKRPKKPVTEIYHREICARHHCGDNENIYGKAYGPSFIGLLKWKMEGKEIYFCPYCGEKLPDNALDMLKEQLEREGR